MKRVLILLTVMLLGACSSIPSLHPEERVKEFAIVANNEAFIFVNDNEASYYITLVSVVPSEYFVQVTDMPVTKNAIEHLERIQEFPIDIGETLFHPVELGGGQSLLVLFLVEKNGEVRLELKYRTDFKIIRY